jgi:hypothetical protein
MAHGEQRNDDLEDLISILVGIGNGLKPIACTNSKGDHNNWYKIIQ